MNEAQKGVLTSMLIGLVGSYIETVQYAVQKELISTKRPQIWKIKNAYDDMFQSAPQFMAQAANPIPVQGTGLDIASLMQTLTQPQAIPQPQAGQPAVAAPAAPQTIQHNGQTYVLQIP